MSLKLYANQQLSFPLGEANFVHSPTALCVGGEQVIMVQRQFSACVLRLNSFCDLVHGDLAIRRTRLWRSGLWHKLSYLRCAPVAGESLFLHSVLMNNYKKG